jgi:hypothetical protein
LIRQRCQSRSESLLRARRVPRVAPPTRSRSRTPDPGLGSTCGASIADPCSGSNERTTILGRSPDEDQQDASSVRNADTAAGCGATGEEGTALLRVRMCHVALDLQHVGYLLAAHCAVDAPPAGARLSRVTPRGGDSGGAGERVDLTLGESPGATCDPEPGHPDRGGPPSGGFEEFDRQMALRVFGHPEDRARFRPVEVLHADPASLARGAHHGSFASAPSSPATIFSPSGLRRSVPRPGTSPGAHRQGHIEGRTTGREPTFAVRLWPTGRRHLAIGRPTLHGADRLTHTRNEGDER